jgi:PASTA domain
MASHRSANAIAMLAALLGAAAGSPVQAQTAMVNGCNGPVFGPGCSLKELVANNGWLRIDLPEATPPVRVIFDRFQGPESRATAPTDFDVIEVSLSAVGGGPSLLFEDRSAAGAWEVIGGATLGVTNMKRDIIKYWVRTEDLNNPGTQVAAIRGALLSAAFTSVRSGNVQDRVEGTVEDRTKPHLVGGNLVAFERALPVGGKRVEDEGTFESPQSEVKFKKEIQLSPGPSVGSWVALREVRQNLALPTDKEVGCAPATIERSGQEDPVQVCSLTPQQGVPAGAGPFADDNGTAILGTIDPSSFEDKVFHYFARRGSARTDFPLELDRIVPTIEPPNFNVLSGFDASSDGQLILIQTIHALLTSAVVGQRALLVDRTSGEFAPLCQVGDVLALPSGDFAVTSIVDARVADGGRAHLTVLLQPPTGSVVQAVLVKDASQLFETGEAPIVASLLPGDVVATPAGPMALANPNLIDVADASGEALFSSAAGQSFHAFRGRIAAGEVVEHVVGTGDPTDAGDGSVVTALQAGGGLSETGEVLILSSQIPGNVQSNRTCAYAWEHPLPGALTLDSRKRVCVGDPLPGSRTLAAILGANASRTGGGALALLTSDPLATIRSGVYAFDSTGTLRRVAESGDAVNVAGVVRRIQEILLAPRTVLVEEKPTWLSSDESGSVALHIEESGEVATVPAVVSRDQALAEADLEAAGSTVGAVSAVDSNDVPAGEVIAQSLAPGERVPVGTPVDLTVSTGPAAIPGDIDGDGDVDRNDLDAIRAARNSPANGPDDPRDLDSDGRITAFDLRLAALLCTRSRCAAE